MAEKKEKERLEKVESIVARMKEKYAKEGLAPGETSSELKELRDLVTGGKTKVKIKAIEQLKESKNKLIQFIASAYSSFQEVLTPLLRAFSNLAVVKRLDYYLYSAHMRFSVAQWLIISVVSSVILSVAIFFLSGLLFTFLSFPLALIFIDSLLLSVGAFLLSSGSLLLYPKFLALRRADLIDAELPFALRHIATQLRAGIGLFRALQTIASQDYGILSEEFSRTITQIEEGTETKEALTKLAYYTQSKSLKRAIAHIVRALRTGGNLSDVMTSIASDTAFEQRTKIRDFAEKMNFFGVVFIFVAIVLPVFIAIFAAVANSPVSKIFIASMPLTPLVITLIYGILMPLLLAFLVIYLKSIQPSV